MTRLVALALTAVLATLAPSAAIAQPATTTTDATLKIPHTRYLLDNGLTVILHEDHSQPLVVANINYNVGSADEEAGRTGFAHLFEHLMFMGTARVPEKKFDEWMETEGARNNAWTSQDRTDYYDVGPSHALPLLLWLEADRLAVLGKQIDLPKLNAQRDVVKNERRQSIENEPYQKAERLVLPTLLFPEGHPYHHSIIGSHADLEAATVSDVRAFFQKWYTPQNACLVVAGDFDPEKVRPMIAQYFGPIDEGKTPPTRSRPAPPAKLTSVVRRTVEDDVTLPKVVMAWLSPALYSRGDAELDLLSEVLTDGKDSRLYRKLVRELELAQSVSAYQASKQLRSHFQIEVVARPGISLDAIEQALDDELATIREQPISDDELVRARNGYETSFVSRMQSLERRASMLNAYQATVGTPDWAGADLRRYLDATVADLRTIAGEVLDPNARVILRIMPEKQPVAPAAGSGPDGQ